MTHNLAKGQPNGDTGRAKGASLGGLAVKKLIPPKRCPCCDRDMTGYTWHQYIGHRGLIAAAKKKGLTPQEFLRNGFTKQDPFPDNGYYQQWEKS